NRSLSFIVQFLPSILAVGTVFGILFISGIWASYKRPHTKYVSLCLFSLCIPLLGILMFSLGPRFTFNVRYTAVAFPYFCIFIGLALAFFYRRNKFIGLTFVMAVIAISCVSLYNHFFNHRYAKEDIRSAVRFFHEFSSDEIILSYNESYPIDRYLTEFERYRH